MALVLFIVASATATFWALQDKPSQDNTADSALPARPYLPDDGPPLGQDKTMPELPAHPGAGLTILTDTSLAKDHEIDGGHNDVLVKIAASDVTLDCAGHRISGATNYGLLVANVSNVTVENCHFDGPFQGLLADNAEKLSIHNSTFTVQNNGMHAIGTDKLFLDGTSFQSRPSPSAGFAVEVKDSKDVTVRKNRIHGFHQGLLFYGVDEFVARDNRIELITETGIGTFQMDKERISKNGMIKGNEIRACMMGLEIHAGSRNIRIEGNNITECSMAVRMDDGYSTPSFSPIEKIHFAGNTLAGNREGNEILVSDKKEVVWEE